MSHEIVIAEYKCPLHVEAARDDVAGVFAAELLVLGYVLIALADKVLFVWNG
jgi:hypothetical protein